jgi:multidrug resistance efflux pump
MLSTVLQTVKSLGAVLEAARFRRCRFEARGTELKNPVELLRRLVQNQRAWRLTITGVILIPIILVLPHARSLVVRNAVTTAYLFSLQAPISGYIEDIGVVAGSVSRASIPLVTIQNDRVDGSRVARLEVLEGRAEKEVTQLRAQLESVRALAATRRLEYESNVASVKQDLVSQLQTVKDRSAARSAALREAQGNRERARRMFRNDLLSPSDVEAAEAAYERALSDYSANELERIRLAGRLEEIEQGVFQVEMPEGVLMTRQATQDLDLEVLGLERQLERSEAEWQATSAETEAAREALRKRAGAEILLPAGKTVWKVHATAGTWVVEGSKLLTFVDCSNLMVDIAVDDATLELIQPDDEIRLRQFGSFKYRTASVILVRGSAGLEDAPALAAEVESRGARKGQVLARLEPLDLADAPRASCGIGRTAYAEFEDLNLFEILILPLFR